MKNKDFYNLSLRRKLAFFKIPTSRDRFRNVIDLKPKITIIK